jgi:2,4-dienoyl-CoA reductase (NADPH2)
MLAGVTYERIDDAGLTISQGGETRLLRVDSIVICAGQEPQRSLVAALETRGISPHLIGGSKIAAELDARRAIADGAKLAAGL